MDEGADVFAVEEYLYDVFILALRAGVICNCSNCSMDMIIQLQTSNSTQEILL